MEVKCEVRFECLSCYSLQLPASKAHSGHVRGKKERKKHKCVKLCVCFFFFSTELGVFSDFVLLTKRCLQILANLMVDSTGICT